MTETKTDSSFVIFIIIVGMVGGIVSLFLFTFCFYFNFITINPKFVLRYFSDGLRSFWVDILLLIVIFMLFSVVVSLIYSLLFRKKNEYYWGLIYGVLMFLLVFGLVHPLFFQETLIINEKVSTFITMFCLFLLYGVFIGYSISYEYEQIEQGFG